MTIADKHREGVPSRRRCSLAFLRTCGRRPTSKNAACAQLLLVGPHQHANAEALHRKTIPTDLGAPLATSYNSQNHFREALRDVKVAAPHAYFDTVDHHFFLLENSQPVIDILSSATCRERVARSAQITHIGPAVRMTKRVGQGLPVPPDGRAIWKPRRPSSHVRHACRVDVASAKPRSHARFLLKRSYDDRHEEGSLRYLSHPCSR
ncbi:hypothetical protein MPL1032_220014 [Mesorhizobium plurifarium]|uniref:Uncharacterized protein n=1 Tax=Mesorhizobium plurifarium TaxID=69974 RepID=A0A0K2VYT6_MESPL|nr:hypothetical protein MPL1032_220014 [Mesorhizobium plurifarium]